MSLVMEEQLRAEWVVLDTQQSQRLLYLSAEVATIGNIGMHVGLLESKDNKDTIRMSRSASQLQKAHTSAACRLPLHLFDDEQFCSAMADAIIA